MLKEIGSGMVVGFCFIRVLGAYPARCCGNSGLMDYVV